MKLSRQVGTVSQLIQVYAQDATVSTGAGLANIIASNVSYSWFRNNQAAVSTAMGSSTGALGVWSSGAWIQMNSATALGWYQFGVPNGAFVSGDSVAIHFYVSSGPLVIMAPLPVEIELTKTNNQQYASSTANTLSDGALKFATVSSDAWPLFGIIDSGAAQSTTANSIRLRAAFGATTNVMTGSTILIYSSALGLWERRLATSWSSSATDWAGVDTWNETPDDNASYIVFATPPGSASLPAAVNLTQVYGSAVVTTAAGTLGVANAGLVGVSTITLSAASTITQGVSVTSFSALITTNANLLQVYGSAVVTSAAGQLRVSTQAIDKGGYGVTTIAAAITTNANLLQVYGSAVVTTAAGQLGVANSGLVGVSTITVGVNVTSFSAAITTNANLMQIYGSAVVTSAAGTLTVSTQTLSGAGSGSVNVTSIAGQPVATSGAGILTVSTQTIPTFASAGAAMALTTGERATLAGVILTTTQAESFRASSAAGSIMQLHYEVLANLTDFSNSGTTRTLNSLTSHAGPVATYQYDSTTPSAITRIG